MLAGGSGPADGFFYLCDDLMPEYNLFSFDYPQAFPDNASLTGETLLFFSKEDTIFTESMKQNLANLMTEPEVVWDLKGGHLAMMASLDEYLSAHTPRLPPRKKRKLPIMQTIEKRPPPNGDGLFIIKPAAP